MKRTGERREPGFDRLVERALALDASVPGEPCPQTELLAAWFDRSLAGDEASRLEGHIASCGQCQQVVAALARSEPEVLKAHPRPEPVPWTWHLHWLVPLAATAVVVLAVATQTVRAPGALPSSTVPPRAPVAASAPQPTTQPPLVALRRDGIPAPPAENRGSRAGLRGGPGSAATGSGTVATDRSRMVVEEGRQAAKRETTMAKAEQAGPPAPSVAAPAPSADARQERFVAPAPPAVAGAPVSAPAAERLAVPTGQAAASAPRDVGKQKTRVSLVAVTPAAAPSFAPGGRVGWRYVRPGVVSKTVDGGATWLEQALPGEARLTLLLAVTPSACWGAGPSGTLVRTADGIAWRVVTPPAPADIVSLGASGVASASVRTADGAAFETSDGGATWRRR